MVQGDDAVEGAPPSTSRRKRNNNVMSHLKLAASAAALAEGGLMSLLRRVTVDRNATRLRIGRVALGLSSAVAVFALWIPVPAAASSCTSYLGSFNNWFITQPKGPGNYYLESLYAANDAAGKYVSYGESPEGTTVSLAYTAAVPPRGPQLPGYPAYVSETEHVSQYFSDRRYSGGGLTTYPFNPAAIDQLGIQIFLQDWPRLNISAGQTVFTLYTWWKSKYTMIGTCQNGLLYGFIGSTLQTLSLNEFFSPKPPAKVHRPTKIVR
jgi:hypothetical protein